MTKNNEAGELKIIFAKGLARRLRLDLKNNKNVKGGILDGFDAALDGSSLGGTKQHVETLKWASNLIDCVADDHKIMMFVSQCSNLFVV